MINTRQIKSRFRRSHLLKLANALLAEDLELKSGTKKWFELRPGHKVEELCDLISFKEVIPGKDEVDSRGRRWHSFYMVFTYKVRNYRGDLIECTKKFEVGCDDLWLEQYRDKLFESNRTDKFKALSFEEQLDKTIMWELMRNCEHVLKDNSSIPIYI